MNNFSASAYFLGSVGNEQQEAFLSNVRLLLFNYNPVNPRHQVTMPETGLAGAHQASGLLGTGLLTRPPTIRGTISISQAGHPPLIRRMKGRLHPAWCFAFTVFFCYLKAPSPLLPVSVACRIWQRRTAFYFVVSLPVKSPLPPHHCRKAHGGTKRRCFALQ